VGWSSPCPLVAGVAARAAGNTFAARVFAFVAVALLGLIVFVVVYFNVLGVACDDYNQCLFT
jgi:hypothetical protein